MATSSPFLLLFFVIYRLFYRHFGTVLVQLAQLSAKYILVHCNPIQGQLYQEVYQSDGDISKEGGFLAGNHS